LNGINVEQARNENRANLDALGGPLGLVKSLKSSVENGLTNDQVGESECVFVTQSKRVFSGSGYEEKVWDECFS
jgi:hypothetical protein